MPPTSHARRAGAAALMALALAGCEGPNVTADFVGRSASGAELRGITQGPAYGEGRIDLTVDDGTACEGSYAHVARQGGIGQVLCADGRVGVVQFANIGLRGAGRAVLDGETFAVAYKVRR